jgi:hypothetical protein
MELFIRHLIYDVLAKKTIDKVLKLIRKLDWDDPTVRRMLHKVFTKPWKITYGNIGLLAMLTYDLQRYHPAFTISVVDQVLEDVRRGLEQNIYNTNQRRLAVMKYLGELYIYRLLSSGIVFDTLWSLVTFGHRRLFFPLSIPITNTSLQLTEDHCLNSWLLSICRMISSVSDSFAFYSIRAECVSIAALRRRN